MQSVQHFDRQDNLLPGATATAAELFDQSVEAFSLYRGDPLTLIGLAIAEAPEFAMAYAFKAYLLAMSTEPAATAEARNVLMKLKAMRLSEREASHAAALRAVVDGNWESAAATLDAHNAAYPRDFVGLHVGHLVDFYRANSTRLRDRIAAALAHWTETTPGYAVLLGMYAFGLEEMGEYPLAEIVGRTAVTLQPLDAWGHHAVAHVMETQGRTQDGIEWMIARAPQWGADDNFFKGHNWWHRALFHLDAMQFEDVLTLYDGPIRGGRSMVALDLVDASAMLWRVHLAHGNVGARWQELATAWDAHADGRTYAFNDWHAVMAYLGADRHGEVYRLLASYRDSSPLSDATRWGQEIAVPLIEGFAAFWRGDYDTALQQLGSVRGFTDRFGGSHAQRDVIAWTMTEAALRAGRRDVADRLVQERLHRKPRSRMNLHLLYRQQALGPRRAA